MTGLPRHAYEEVIVAALAEDLGVAGDLTSDAVVAADARAAGRLVARQEGRVAGVEVAAAVFAELDPAIRVEIVAGDGADVAAGAVLATVAGPARGILTAERTALNLLGRMCGIATATRDLMRLVAGTRARIADTRKTTPGLRALEKHAVRMGGGVNHRFGLYDAVLIKDNHLALAGSVADAIKAARTRAGHLVRIEVEVESSAQMAEAIAAGADVVMLDNMSPGELRQAVDLAAGRVTLEASGGITPATVRAVAETGVDLISVGWITHSAPALDVALDLD